MAYIYNADVYCDECGKDILQRDGLTEHDDDGDSDTCPKYHSDDSESDCPQHCGSGADCLAAEVLDDDSKVGALIGTSLTSDGMDYVREACLVDSPCTRFWRSQFFYIDFPNDDTDVE